MCYNCGCSLPDDNMGSDDNITTKSFEHIAKEEGKSVEQVQKEVYQMLKNGRITSSHVTEMFIKASKVWGQSIEEAEKNTKELLEQQLGI